MNTDLRQIYDWTRRTRAHLLDFLDTVPTEIYTLERPDFAYGSIRNIQAHLAFAYMVWVGVVGLNVDRAQLELPAIAIPDSQAMRERFREVDLMLEDAFEKFQNPDAMFEYRNRAGDVLQLTQRWLIVRPITHEFHHKGQLLALARVLGHPLPEHIGTDLVGPFEV
jgi:uncharacterized damage-inducible protein DinB